MCLLPKGDEKQISHKMFRHTFGIVSFGPTLIMSLGGKRYEF
ncbi:hypothetical protein CR513_35821, partial [Mucuna pruriens]